VPNWRIKERRDLITRLHREWARNHLSVEDCTCDLTSSRERFPRLRTFRPHRRNPQALRTAGPIHGARPQPREFLSKDRRQAEGLVELHRENRGRHCRLVTISTTNITATNEFRAAWMPTGHLFPTRVDRSKGSRYREYTDPTNNPMIPHVIGAGYPSRRLFKNLQRLLVFGRPTVEELRQDLRAVSKKCRPDWTSPTPEPEGGVATGSQGTLLFLTARPTRKQSATRSGDLSQRNVTVAPQLPSTYSTKPSAEARP